MISSVQRVKIITIVNLSHVKEEIYLMKYLPLNKLEMKIIT